MQGLEIARRYHAAHRDQLLAPWAAYRGRIAAGLVGPGSECLGHDDESSRDHDFGPGFCLWLTDEDHAAIGAALQFAYEQLPADFEGIPPRQPGARSGKRVGVFAISAFYGRFLGAPQLPVNDADWLQIPEPLLATATNGAVFDDALGRFSEWRMRLLAYYPAQALRRKLAQAVAGMAQNGQYNLPRALRRDALPTATLCLADFVRNACLAAHVLSRRFAPPDKWLHRNLLGLPRLSGLHAELDALVRAPIHQSGEAVERICARVLQELVFQGFTRGGDAFLEAHVDTILGKARGGMA
ncbi:DUF4037 domain-containing protein [Uliginosibacterium sp. H1]|uniref:DUF4037 domain-containing protein n=1 Tax=Uliginosibacterium sp. H1 TaxID=3114757 RepID=UPI002E17D671|nr:DUF4037 domain-containing protein [Uliginosibacterium sp. H1]